MNYIFLDCDGVINNQRCFIENNSNGKHNCFCIDDNSLNLLAKLTKKYNCRIVLSSSWRRGFNKDLTPKYKEGGAQSLLDAFKKVNILLYDITRTDIYEKAHWERPIEINCYIKEHFNQNDNYVILDDDDIIREAIPELRAELKKHFVKTNFYTNGFDEAAYKKAETIFNK